MKLRELGMATCLLCSLPALAPADDGLQEAESMPWELSTEEQAALKQRAVYGDTTVANCGALNSSFPMRDESVHECLRINRATFQAVYEDYLSSHPDTRGSVTLLLQVNHYGRVVSSGVIGLPTLPMELAESMRVRASLILFPTSENGWRGQYELTFAPP